jgi:hypothetical protein
MLPAPSSAGKQPPAKEATCLTSAVRPRATRSTEVDLAVRSIRTQAYRSTLTKAAPLSGRGGPTGLREEKRAHFAQRATDRGEAQMPLENLIQPVVLAVQDLLISREWSRKTRCDRQWEAKT